MSRDTSGQDRQGNSPSCTAATGRTTRRGWSRAVLGSAAGWGFVACGATVVVWTAATLRFLMNNSPRDPPAKLIVGSVDEYPADHVEQKFKEKYGLWVVNGVYRAQRQIYALAARCTHLGCITLWNESERVFQCPCHGSGFHQDGVNFCGPAPRPLPRYAIRIAEDGQLEVDRSRVFRQELGQWDDPDCYVPA